MLSLVIHTTRGKLAKAHTRAQKEGHKHTYGQTHHYIVINAIVEHVHILDSNSMQNGKERNFLLNGLTIKIRKTFKFLIAQEYCVTTKVPRLQYYITTNKPKMLFAGFLKWQELPVYISVYRKCSKTTYRVSCSRQTHNTCATGHHHFIPPLSLIMHRTVSSTPASLEPQDVHLTEAKAVQQHDRPDGLPPLLTEEPLPQAGQVAVA